MASYPMAASPDGISWLNQHICRPVSQPSSDRASQRIWRVRSASSDGGSPSPSAPSGRSALTMAARARRSLSLARTGVVIAVPLSPLPVPGYAGGVGLGIRRTSDGGHLVGPPTVGVSDLGSESAEVTRHDDDGAGR